MYLFLNLPHKGFISPPESDNIFNISENLLKKEFSFFASDIDLLRQEMLEDSYYVIHENITVKGKSKKLRGKVVISDKDSILSYLAKTIKENDIRPLRIIPEKSYQTMIYISDEGTILVFK